MKDKEKKTVDINKKQRKSLRLTDRSASRESTFYYKSQNDGEFKRPNPIDDNSTKVMRHLPPPLPPKPKNLVNNDQNKKKIDTKVNKKPVFIDHPTSSFV